MRSKRIADRAAGVILLEALFALLIIAIGLGAISGLLNHSISQIRQARLRTRAMLLAESKLAEIQVGLVDVTQAESGDFDDHPPGFFWSATLAAAEVQALKTLTLTITCLGDEAFDYQVHRIFSPSLNFSLEKLKEMASDPAQLQSLEAGSGFQEVLMMLNELPGSELLLERLMGGGVTDMMGLFTKLISGKLSPEELAELGLDLADADAAASVLSVSTGSGGLPVWTNNDTAGTIETAEASRGRESPREDRPGPEGEETTEGDKDARGPDEADVETAESQPAERSSGPVTRREAMRRMMEILRRMAAQPK